MAAATAGNHIALANKESMVAAGALVNRALEQGGGHLIPVDSEHSAILQCLLGDAEPRRVVLTASGGPFRGKDTSQLENVTPEEALAHPNWKMGRRITIDSATLVNKALEVLEAAALFRLGLEQVDVVLHPESIVHSLVVFGDGSIKAQLGVPDMRLPIAYALTYPDRASTEVIPDLDLSGVTLHFEAPDRVAFPALDLGYEAGRRGGTAPAVFNAADEIAVAAFLDGELGFLGIPAVIAETLDRIPVTALQSIDDVVQADREAREMARSVIAKQFIDGRLG
jgi:1-deoxy-D-xylulose-5-phosphate reductoisomerase